jgi:hypothetical protein
MDVGEISSNAFKYPSTDFKKIIILGILSITSFLIIPAFLNLGYLFRILKTSINGSEEPPEFDEWGNMFIDGLKVFLVILIYTIVPTVLIMIGIWASLIPMVMAQTVAISQFGSLNNILTLSFGFMTGLTAIGGFLAIIISFFIAIALANMAYHDKLGAAFRFSEIIQNIREIGWVDYLIWYIVMLIIGAAYYFISFFLVFPLIIGIILVPLVISPYFMMFFARSTALVYLYGGVAEYLRSSETDLKRVKR